MKELSTYTYRPRHISVVDGDTFDVELDLGFSIFTKIRLRLRAADTPEVYGVKKESAEYQAGKLASKRVEELFKEAQEADGILIVTHKFIKGKYGRYLADVFLDRWEDHDGERNIVRRSLADILIEEGHAELWTK